jgi:hypothetical protein
MAQENIKSEFVTMERKAEACHVITESFIKANGIYKKNEAAYAEFYPVAMIEL